MTEAEVDLAARGEADLRPPPVRLEIHDIPPDIMALMLIPAILLGDVARGAVARISGRR